MKIHTQIAIFLLLYAGTAERAWPDVVVPIESVDSFVNIRLAPDAASEIVGRLQQGSQLRYVRTVDEWYEVELEGGGTGFVSVDWARLLADDEGHVAAEAGDTAAPIAATTDQSATIDAAVEPAPLAESAAESEPAAKPEAEIVPVAEAPPESEPAVEAVPEVVVPAEAPAAVETEPLLPPPAETLAPPVVKGGSVDYLAKFSTPTEIRDSQVFDNGRNVGIGTTEPQQRLEVNGNIQIHERGSNFAGLMITQSSGDTGYIMHNGANTLTIGAGSIDRVTITSEGNVGFSVNRPAHPIEMASGAHVSTGGVWTDSSSIEKKENVRELTPEEALHALARLEPVRFNYKADRGEEYVGFIAEDVPELVATADRRGLSPMDIVAVLTSVVQQQQEKIEALEARLDRQTPAN
jgi:Bacterial SH3 domain/Chaperone of endosialidase